MPIETEEHEIKSIISQRAIDYELMRNLVREIQKRNVVFYCHEDIEAYATLDALGAIRGKLIRHKGDIHQISLLDRIGELTVSIFNLKSGAIETENPGIKARIYSLK